MTAVSSTDPCHGTHSSEMDKAGFLPAAQNPARKIRAKSTSDASVVENLNRGFLRVSTRSNVSAPNVKSGKVTVERCVQTDVQLDWSLSAWLSEMSQVSHELRMPHGSDGSIADPSRIPLCRTHARTTLSLCRACILRVVSLLKDAHIDFSAKFFWEASYLCIDTSRYK